MGEKRVKMGIKRDLRRKKNLRWVREVKDQGPKYMEL